MGSAWSSPIGFDLSDKEKSNCITLNHDAAELFELRKLGVKVLSAEFVVHLRRKDKSGSSGEQGGTADVTAATAEEVCRVLRVAILTQGTVQIEARQSSFGASCCPGMLHYDPPKKYPNVLLSLRDLQLICHDNSRNLMVFAARNYLSSDDVDGEVEIAVYQTPHPGRFLQPVSEALVGAFSGVPGWAVPVQWKIGFSLPQISWEKTADFLGEDGGFSSAFWSSLVAIMIRSHLSFGSLSQHQAGASHISGLISDQQPPGVFRHKKPQVLDVVNLVDTLFARAPSAVRFHLILEALNCLPFNLIFRTLLLKNIEMTNKHAHFGRSLSRVLLYNVTLREVNLSGTNLKGLGEELGQALAMNIQPLFCKMPTPI